MNKKLLIATRSKGKFPEIAFELRNLPLELLNLNDIQSLPPNYEVEESALTFEGNAIIKAMTIGKNTQLMVLADDSGLEVDALNGRPGVYSARYATGTDQDRYEKLLSELENVPDDKLGAQFHCVIAIYDPATDRIRTCEGIYRGKIIREPRGSHGFGYDPIFFNETLNKTNAEMTTEEKNSVSHRGVALKKTRAILKTDFL